MTAKKVGVLALQGAFQEHLEKLHELGVETSEVRLPEHLHGLDGLIIPGGESTAIGRLMVRFGLVDPLKNQIREGLPTWGTCAGMILLAKEIVEQEHPTILGLLNVRVRRNAFGRQVASFESDLVIPVLGEKRFPAIFIRAPYIEEAGENVEILARLSADNGTIIACRQDNILATAFHPELSEDMRFHQYFLKLLDGLI